MPAKLTAGRMGGTFENTCRTGIHSRRGWLKHSLLGTVPGEPE